MCTTAATWTGRTSRPTGSASTTRPFTSRKPVGLFIHAFAAITKNAPATPDTTMGSRAQHVGAGDIRSQPKR